VLRLRGGPEVAKKKCKAAVTKQQQISLDDDDDDEEFEKIGKSDMAGLEDVV